MPLFKKKVKSEIDGLESIKKKNRKKALKLLEEYNKGLVIKIGENLDQKEKIKEIRERI